VSAQRGRREGEARAGRGIGWPRCKREFYRLLHRVISAECFGLCLAINLLIYFVYGGWLETPAVAV
jgi:hypothetical protein